MVVDGPSPLVVVVGVASVGIVDGIAQRIVDPS